MSLVEKLYNHWSYGAMAVWGAVGFIFMLYIAFAKPTNYDTILFMGTLISWLCTCMYCKIIDDMHSDRIVTKGVERIINNDNFSPEEKTKRVELYRRQF